MKIDLPNVPSEHPALAVVISAEILKLVGGQDVNGQHHVPRPLHLDLLKELIQDEGGAGISMKADVDYNNVVEKLRELLQIVEGTQVLRLFVCFVGFCFCLLGWLGWLVTWLVG